MKELEGFRDFVNELMETWKVPGIAISILKNREVILSEGFGKSNIENHLKTSPGTIFGIGSTTKSFTTTALGILVDRHKLEWDAPLKKYIPEFNFSDFFTTEQITPLDLVTHRTGLPCHEFMWVLNNFKSRRELVEKLQYLELNAPIRTTFQYNNFTFVLAGYLIERITNMSWEDFITKNILHQLEMKNTCFSFFDSQKSNDFSFSYKEKNDSVEKMKNIDDTIMNPARGIYSCLTDMTKWIEINLNKGKYKDKQIISKDTLFKIHSPHIIIPIQKLSNEFSYNHYGMGWRVEPYKGHYMIHHGGRVNGFSANISFMPLDNIGVVILSNLKDNPLPHILLINIYERLLNMDITDWNARFLNHIKKTKEFEKTDIKNSNKNQVHNSKPIHKIEDYVGCYKNDGYGILKIVKNDSKLKIIAPKETFILEHIHFNVFEFRNENAEKLYIYKVNFITDYNGKVNSVSIPFEESVKDIIFNRIED